jgi:cell division protein FtsA
MILTEVKRSGYDNLLPAGVVLCGGTAELAGIKTIAREALQMPVRVGAPHDLEGFTDKVSAPAFATSVGLLQWGWEESLKNPEVKAARNGHTKGSNPLGRLFGWTRHLLPE